MTPELSRRAAAAINSPALQTLKLDKRLAFAEAVIAANTFADLPRWAADLISDAERGSTGRTEETRPEVY